MRHYGLDWFFKEVNHVIFHNLTGADNNGIYIQDILDETYEADETNIKVIVAKTFHPSGCYLYQTVSIGGVKFELWNIICLG